MKIVFILGLIACAFAEEATNTTKGVVAIVKFEQPNSKIEGTLQLEQLEKNGPVTITGKITGLTEGKHGFHVHEKGDLSNDCKAAGGHFNPGKKNHGAPNDTERHVGDLGNIEADNAGTAMVNITDKMISLTGSNTIIGRAIVVHGGEDDLGKGNQTDSLTTGHAGDRVGCGIVGLISPTDSSPNSGISLNGFGFAMIIPILSMLLFKN